MLHVSVGLTFDYSASLDAHACLFAKNTKDYFDYFVVKPSEYYSKVGHSL